MMTWHPQAPPQVPPTGPHTAFATQTPPQPLIMQYVKIPRIRPGYAPQKVPPPGYQAQSTNRGRGRSRGGRGRVNSRTAYDVHKTTSSRPTQTFNYGSTAFNPVKRYNNWNYCVSCGFDVPGWHNSTACPPEYRRVGHQEECTRANVQS